ncbi:cyclase family protein [Blastococcus sp. SYSU D00820]
MLSEQEFRALVAAVDRTGRWPGDPRRGALGFLSREATLRGLATVTEGRVVSCADRAAAQRALGAGDGGPAITTSVDAAHDWLAVNEVVRYRHHGADAMTHLDSLGHFFYGGRGFGGTTPDVVAGDGVGANDVRPAADGVVGRGVLLDLPRLVGEPHLPADRLVTLPEVQAWLAATGTEVRSGDLLFIRTGRPHSPPVPPGAFPQVGTLDLGCARWVHDQEFALVLTDAGLDSPTPLVQDVATPWHVLTLVALGLFLVDGADFEELSASCAESGRTTFLAVLAALPLPGATASPVNPLAVL